MGPATHPGGCVGRCIEGWSEKPPQSRRLRMVLASAVPSGASHYFARGQVRWVRSARAAFAAAERLAAAHTSAPRISPRGFRRVCFASSRSVVRRPCGPCRSAACPSVSPSSRLSPGGAGHLGLLSLPLAAVSARAPLLVRPRLLARALVAGALGSVRSCGRRRGASVRLRGRRGLAWVLIRRDVSFESKNLGLF